MRLVLMRHGEAAFGADSDVSRALTDRGHKQAKATARQLTKWVTENTQVLFSPYLRTTETANNVLEVLKQETSFSNIKGHAEPILKAGTDFQKIAAWLQEVESEDLIIISHNPMMTELTNVLVYGQQVIHQPLPLVFDTGYACCLDGEYPTAGCMDLIRRIIPDC